MLYVVATPIGNLGDMSPRAIETLRKVDLVAVEDTRMTMKLMSAFDIHTPLTSYHRHNEQSKGESLLRKIKEENLSVALVTDAGTPAISDPGSYLVNACLLENIPVVAVPGPCAVATALSVSGFDSTEFTFYGFLPREKKALKQKLKSMIGQQIAIVSESPYRVIDLMECVVEVLPNTRVSASCDLTKLHELTIRGTALEVLNALQANEKSNKGEYALVFDLRNEVVEEVIPTCEASLEAQLFELLLQGMDMKTAIKTMTEKGKKKKEVYSASLVVKAFIEES